MKRRYNQIFNKLLPVFPDDLLPEIRNLNEKLDRSVVVLDDDPLGTQTVYGVSVLTQWDVKILSNEFLRKNPCFYVLTNSRALSEERAIRLARDIGENLMQVKKRTGRAFTVISRSDSTLRGHFPAEVNTIADSTGNFDNPVIFVPFFLEGGRYTIGDIHYVAEGDWLIPAGETTYAQDTVLGYKSSNLKEWIAEKSGGKIKQDRIKSVSLTDIRKGGPEKVEEILNLLPDSAVCIINAANYRDLEVICLALLRLEIQGKQYIYRTAASFVRTFLGLDSKPLITRRQLRIRCQNGGLIIVGSYVKKTTEQLDYLLEKSDIYGIEIPVERFISSDTGNMVEKIVAEIESKLKQGRNVMMYTSRRQLKGDDSLGSIDIGSRISDGLVRIVQSVKISPRFLLTKGGATSSDIITKGVGVTRAIVLGQIIPGVPVWHFDESQKFPGITCVVFPGNVGDSQSVLEAFKKLI